MSSMVGTSRTGRLLRRLVRLSCRRPVLTTLLSLILAIAGIAYTLHALTFKTSGRDLLPKDARYVVRYNQFAHEFGDWRTSSSSSRRGRSRRPRPTPRAWCRNCEPRP